MTNLTGNHYRDSVCMISDTQSACSSDFTFFGIEKSQSFLYLIGDGYLGLGNGVGWGQSETSARGLNAIDQMLDRGMISKKQFGIQIAMKDSEKNCTSSIRFGGYDESKLRKNHDVLYIKTVDNDSWAVPLMQIDFTKDHLLGEPSKALMNPGFQYIAAPIAEFEKFKDDLRKTYPEDPIVCTRWDWCYFVHHCDKVKEKLPPMKFTFGDSQLKQTLELPPSAFLFQETDFNGLDICHLGVIGQEKSGLDYWILGESFMQHFYIVYDATEKDDQGNEKLYIGLSYEPEAGTHIVIFILGGICVGLLFVIGFLAILIHLKERSKKKYEAQVRFLKAKHSLEQEDEEDEDDEV